MNILINIFIIILIIILIIIMIYLNINGYIIAIFIYGMVYK